MFRGLKKFKGGDEMNIQDKLKWMITFLDLIMPILEQKARDTKTPLDDFVVRGIKLALDIGRDKI